MALALPPVLLAAQDAKVRNPIVKLEAGSFDESIPFIGRRLDESTGIEKGLSVIMHSTGRIYAACVRDMSIQLAYTDTERTQFTYLDMASLGGSECVLTELLDGNIGLIVDSTACILSPEGDTLSRVYLPSQFDKCYGMAVLRRSADYLLMFSIPATAVKPAISGSYTDTGIKQYTLKVVGDGTNAEARFMYYQSSQILAMSNGQPVEFEKGLSVVWPDALYFDGQEFYFTAYGATCSEGYCVLRSIPSPGTTLEIAGITYTFVAGLDPSAPYQIQIDSLSSEITMENLNCAINASIYEGSGVGFRYSPGTAANPYVSGNRDRGTARVTLKAKVGGKLTYQVVCSDNSIEVGAVAKGADASLGVVTTVNSCKTMISTTTDFKKFTVPTIFFIKGVGTVRDKKQYSFTKIPDGRTMLTFDCITSGHSEATSVTNLFYAVSTDNGESWSNAYAISDYTTPQAVVGSVRTSVKNNTSLTLSYTESTGSLLMNAYTHSHINNASGGNVLALLGGSVFNVDFVRRRAYVSSNGLRMGSGYGPRVNAIVEIDIDAWTVTRSWTIDSYPALPRWMAGDVEVFVMAPLWYPSYSDSPYVCMCATTIPSAWSNKIGALFVLDVTTSAMRTLSFRKWVKSNDANYVLQQNIDFQGSDIIPGAHRPLAIRAIAAQEKLWVLMSDEDDLAKHELAYFDLTEMFDATVKRYNLHTVYKFNSDSEGLTFLYDAKDNLWVITTENTVKVIDAASYGTLYDVNRSTVSNLPKNGLRRVAYRNGKLYASANNTENEAKYNGVQGLCIIELDLMLASYYRPPTAPEDYYGSESFQSTCLGGANALIGASHERDLLIFNEASKTWRVINSLNTQGYTDLMWDARLTYDDASGAIYTAGGDLPITALVNHFQMINLEGYVSRTYLRNVNLVESAFEFGSPKLLIKGNSESNATTFNDPNDNALYCFWQRKSRSNQKIFYDKEVVPLDLSKYLLRGNTISMSKTIDNVPNTLTFSVAVGHLFDTTNTASALSGYFQKGKKIKIRLGENINGIEMYQGLPDVYVITKTSLAYARGQYPVLSVECSDRRYLFEQVNIVASEYFLNTPPHNVMTALLKKHCAVEDRHIRLDAVDELGAHITGQFIDQNALSSLNEIAERFGYFLYVDAGDILTMKKIDVNKEPDHVCTGSTWLVDYTPDDSFADFTNKITVTGESSGKVAVLMPEELALTDSGTVGWWNRKKTKRLHYSTDEQRVYVNPRLVKIESATSIAFKLAGQVEEYISSPATVNTYVDVTIEAPNIIPIILSGLGMILMSKSIPPTLMGGQSKIAAFLETTGLYLVLQCLCAVSNYQYEIYAQPVGYIRRSFQSSAMDTDLIKQLNNTVIEKKIDNSYCYTQAHCKKVANFEMMVTKAQRSRLKLTKVMHMQDEVSDIIQLNHPHSNLKQRIFITDITREILIPEQGGEGHCLDIIEGWKL